MPGSLDISPGTGVLLLGGSIFLLLLILCSDCLCGWLALARARRAALMALLTQRAHPHRRTDTEDGTTATRPPPEGGAPSAADLEAGATDTK